MSKKVLILSFILSSHMWVSSCVYAEVTATSASTSATTAVAPAKPNCLTSECHSNLIEKKFLHGPIKSKGCTICHQIEGHESYLIKVNGQAKSHAILKKTLPADINESCFVCHDEHKAKLHKAKKVHTAIEKKSCVGCHDPHQSDYKTLLKQNPKKELCVSCHEEIGAKFKSAIYHPLEKMEEGCLTCHEAHASASPTKLLKMGSVEELCLKCHNKVKVSNLGTADKPAHKPVREQACLKCHDVHGSKRKNLLTFEYTKDDPGLCMSCHDLKTTQYRNGNVDLHQLHLKDAKNKKACQSCHEAHQSIQDHLIRTEFEARDALLPLRYKASNEGGNCATACHKTFEYNRSEKVKNESDR